MIHLCTIATLMFVQNNTSQKILFIAARTIQFPGVVFKVCIYLIVCHRHLKYIFRCQKYPYLSKIYISAINDKINQEKKMIIKRFCSCGAGIVGPLPPSYQRSQPLSARQIDPPLTLGTHTPSISIQN